MRVECSSRYSSRTSSMSMSPKTARPASSAKFANNSFRGLFSQDAATKQARALIATEGPKVVRVAASKSKFQKSCLTMLSAGQVSGSGDSKSVRQKPRTCKRSNLKVTSTPWRSDFSRRLPRRPNGKPNKRLTGNRNSLKTNGSIRVNMPARFTTQLRGVVSP